MVSPAAGAVILVRCRSGILVLCQVTRNAYAYADPQAIELGQTDFAMGSLHVASYARPGKSFTCQPKSDGDAGGQAEGATTRRDHRVGRNDLAGWRPLTGMSHTAGAMPNEALAGDGQKRGRA